MSIAHEKITLFWHGLWILCGKPETGQIARIMRFTRNNYNYKIRKMKNESRSRARLQTIQPTSGGSVTASPPPAMDPIYRFLNAGHADPLDGWRCCSQKRVMSRPIQVWICDICHKQRHVRKQISIRRNRLEHWVHLRCAGIRQAQYTSTWTCHLHR